MRNIIKIIPFTFLLHSCSVFKTNTNYTDLEKTKKEIMEGSAYKNFKIGKFTYEGREEEVEIIRTNKTQTEIYNGGKSKLILNIEWVNDSTYLLTHKESINASGCLNKGDWIKATIIDTKKDKYTCSYTSNKCGEGKSVFIKLD